jgi:hypothetical protein
MKSIVHRDGTVTIWNVFTQAWERTRRPSDAVLASLDPRTRARVLAHLARSHRADDETSHYRGQQ